MTDVETAPAAPAPPAPAPSSGGRRWWHWIAIAIGAGLVLLVLMQLVPYGKGSNPPVTKAAVWPSASAQAIAESACYDCHSNLTKRWWATKVAPASWLAQHDVDGGRANLNFSEWDKPQAALDEVLEAVRGGGMPPIQYKLLHANARLSAAERDELAKGLQQLYATDPPAGVKQGG